jgi:glycosyltransferase involved in cell wall biosynthesis
MQKDISIIIPTYGRVAALTRCLNSLSKPLAHAGSLTHEIIVVADSRDKVAERQLALAGILTEDIKCVRAGRPGVNAARNKGIKSSGGRICYFLDDDCLILSDRWLADVRDKFRAYPQANAIGGGYILPPEAKMPAMLRHELTALFIKKSRRAAQQSAALLGGNTGYRRESFERYGFFDETLWYGAAETEYNDRLIKNKEKLLYFEDISVVHAESECAIFRYLAKSFWQGAGTAYSRRKNDCGEAQDGKTDHAPWASEILKDKTWVLTRKAAALMFLYAHAVCYRAGLGAGYLNRPDKDISRGVNADDGAA